MSSVIDEQQSLQFFSSTNSNYILNSISPTKIHTLCSISVEKPNCHADASHRGALAQRPRALLREYCNAEWSNENQSENDTREGDERGMRKMRTKTFFTTHIQGNCQLSRAWLDDK